MTIGTQAIVKGFNHAGAYQHSFGILPTESCYYNPFKEIDQRPGLKDINEAGMKSIQMKALGPETGGAGTAGYALVPVYVDQRIVDQSRKYTPLVEIIPRVTNQGLTADYNKVTAKGGGFTAHPDAAMNETDDTYDRVSKPIKFLYSVGRVLGQMQAAMPSYMMEGFQAAGSGIGPTSFAPAGAPNAKQLEVLMKARAMKELEEELIVNGSVASDSTQFDGIVIQQGTENKTDLNTADLTWDDIENTIQAAYDDSGRPSLGVASSAVVTDIRKLMIDQFRYTPADFGAGNTLPFGVPGAVVIQSMVGPIPIIPSQYLSNTSGSKSIYFLDMDYVEMRVLQDMTYEDLAHTNDSNKFMLKIYECLLLRAVTFNAWIGEIK